MKFSLPIHEYYLERPGQFRVRQEIISEIPSGYFLLRPLVTAICGSDLLYFRGEKSSDKLAQRLPLVLLHEGVCIHPATGRRYVPIAGNTFAAPPHFKGRENLWPDMPYLGATVAGLGRTHFIYPKTLSIPVPDGIPNDVASLTEPFSIVLRALEDSHISKAKRIGIVGTGGIAYFLALALIFLKRVKPHQIVIFGVNDHQLKHFQDVGIGVNYCNGIAGEYLAQFDIVYEAVGGLKIHRTITAAMALVSPGGLLGILGVSDEMVSFPANKLVNHGIRIQGISRSSGIDYKKALKLFSIPEVANLIQKNVINDQQFVIDSLEAMQQAFQFASELSSKGRVLLVWPQIGASHEYCYSSGRKRSSLYKVSQSATRN